MPDPLRKVGRISTEHQLESADPFSPSQPYRTLNVDRLKISGNGQWPLAHFLDGILWLPFL